MTTEAVEQLHPAVYEEVTGMLRDLFEHVRQLDQYQGKRDLPFPPEPPATQPETDPDMLAAQERERAHELERIEAEKADLQRRINSQSERNEKGRHRCPRIHSPQRDAESSGNRPAKQEDRHWIAP